MFGFLRRKPEPEPVKPQGGSWTLDDVVADSQPQPDEHVVTQTGPNTYLHTFRAPPQTDAQRRMAEDRAVAEYDAAMAPGFRRPMPQRRPSVFGRPPNRDSFPG